MASTSSDLIQSVRSCDQHAWGRLVRVYGALVYYWCRYDAGLTPEDSEDVLQAVFMAVARRIGDFQLSGNGTFRGWLRVITTNKIRDHLRRESQHPQAPGGSDAARRFQEIPENFSDGHSSGDASHCDQTVLINRLLEELKPRFDSKSWAAFWRAEVAGLSRNEVADELQMSVAAVNQAIYRIRKCLRAELDDFQV